MTKTLITGGTGFIGSHLARALAARGDDLRLLIRSANPAEHLAELEFERVNGEITDRRAVRRAVAGVDRAFHVAGTTSMRRGAASKVIATNVGGTRILCEEALEAGVGRVVHCSSAAAIGPAPPRGRADETQAFPAAARRITYVYSKHEAEGEALRVAAHGLDVVIVNPTFVLGPDDPTGTSMGLVRRFLQREIPVYVDGGINISDVRDVAQGQILADEVGASGERYLLAGRNFTLQRLFADLERISGVPAPALKLPSGLAQGAADAVERFGLPVPVSADEVRSASLWWTYTPAKAKRELGYRPRPHEETLADAVAWQSEQLGDRVGRSSGVTDLALGAARRAGRLAGRLNPL
jgi:dihydroflavonol-4-reductase